MCESVGKCPARFDFGTRLALRGFGLSSHTTPTLRSVGLLVCHGAGRTAILPAFSFFGLCWDATLESTLSAFHRLPEVGANCAPVYLKIISVI